MRSDAVWARVIVVDGTGLRIQRNADKAADRTLERESMRIDYIDARVRAIGQIVFGTVRIDPADVERAQRVSRDLDRRQTSRLRGGRRPRTSAWCSKRAGVRNRQYGGSCRSIKTDPQVSR